MTRLYLLILTLVFLAIPGLASATTLHDAITANATGKNVSVSDKGSIGIRVTITNTATVTFQGSTDGGDTWDTLNSCVAVGGTTGVGTATASGQFQCSTAGLTHIQAPVTGCSSCTVTVKALPSMASSGGASTDTGLLSSLLAIFTDVWDTVLHGLNVTLVSLLKCEDEANNLCMVSGGVVRQNTGWSITSATTSSIEIVPTGLKNFMAQMTNATSETKAFTLTIYGNWTSSTTGALPICTITVPSTATVTHLEDTCPWWAFHAPYSFYFFTASVYTSASAAPLTVHPMY